MAITDFTTIAEDRKVFVNEHFFIVEDLYPVSPGHMLVISNHPYRDFLELPSETRDSLCQAIDQAVQIIRERHQPQGFNIGMNCGAVAGQTVFHFHCHVIPRYTGDMSDPRGGVRHCVEGKGYY
jgi:diadenosine tetraphosphate (Ap4A) HIT family hydrolase